MTTTASGHPPSDWISAYVAGAATDGVATLVAAHLETCAACRARAAGVEAVGGAIFASAPLVEMAPGAFDELMARIDAAPAQPPAAAEASPGPALPRAVREAVGVPIETLRWRFRMPGVHEAELLSAGPERVSLLRVKPGAGVPAHTHTGVEATLVLTGALMDRGRRYGPGDVAVATDEDDHHPKAGDEGECLCLAVMTGGLRFTGALGRALNLFAE